MIRLEDFCDTFVPSNCTFCVLFLSFLLFAIFLDCFFVFLIQTRNSNDYDFSDSRKFFSFYFSVSRKLDFILFAFIMSHSLHRLGASYLESFLTDLHAEAALERKTNEKLCSSKWSTPTTRDQSPASDLTLTASTTHRSVAFKMRKITALTARKLRTFLLEESGHPEQRRILSLMNVTEKNCLVGCRIEQLELPKVKYRYIGTKQWEHLLNNTSFSEKQLLFLNCIFCGFEDKGLMNSESFWKIVSLCNGSNEFFSHRADCIDRMWLSDYLNSKNIIGNRFFSIFGMIVLVIIFYSDALKLDGLNFLEFALAFAVWFGFSGSSCLTQGDICFDVLDIYTEGKITQRSLDAIEMCLGSQAAFLNSARDLINRESKLLGKEGVGREHFLACYSTIPHLTLFVSIEFDFAYNNLMEWLLI